MNSIKEGFKLRKEKIEAQFKKKEIDQTFHLCGLRNKTSLFVLQSHSN